MQLAKVIGDIVATQKDANLAGVTLLLLQPIALDGSSIGRRSSQLTRSGAGVGETVFFVRGKEASFPFYPTEVPADAGIRRHRRSLGPRMILARVVGTVVATQKHRKFEGAKLLLVQPLTIDDQPRARRCLPSTPLAPAFMRRC
jgi:microcompartment protein CcmK/EutM